MGECGFVKSGKADNMSPFDPLFPWWALACRESHFSQNRREVGHPFSFGVDGPMRSGLSGRSLPFSFQQLTTIESRKHPLKYDFRPFIGFWMRHSSVFQ